MYLPPRFSTATREMKTRLWGCVVILFDAVPTQGDIPAHILRVARQKPGIFLLGAGIMGAIFGSFFAHGLTSGSNEYLRPPICWSEGDFSRYIDDTTGDEISQFAQRLNNMAKQLQSLLRRRQDMAVSEERNRLARDLHDSAKQQALAASFELGTALTLYERDPQPQKNTWWRQIALVDSVRKELTNLVHELRPQSVDGGFFRGPERVRGGMVSSQWDRAGYECGGKSRIIAGDPGNPVPHCAGSPGKHCPSQFCQVCRISLEYGVK